jgi:hypothetical protein
VGIAIYGRPLSMKRQDEHLYIALIGGINVGGYKADRMIA